MWLTKEPRRAATPHRAEGRTCSRRVHRQHELLPSHGRDWEEKGAILSEIARASRRQYDTDIGRLSDDMPKFCTLAGEFNSCWSGSRGRGGCSLDGFRAQAHDAVSAFTGRVN